MSSTNILDLYLNTYEHYASIYDKDKVVVAIQVGSFFEFYATNDKGPDLYRLSDVLNIVVSRKDKSNPIVDKTNPYLAGYPTISHSKFLKLMLNAGYIVVVIEQTTPPPNPQRKVTGVFTPSTTLDETSPENNFLMTVLIDEISRSQFIIGMTLIDVSTGEVFVHETCSDIIYDEKFPLDEIVHVYNSYQANEVLLIIDKLQTYTVQELVEYLECGPNLYYCKTLNEITYNVENLNFQRELLHKIYPDVDKSSFTVNQIFETLDLEKMSAGRTALCIVLDHVYNNNPNCLKRLHQPQPIKLNKTLYLGNNALQQLDIFANISTSTQNQNSNKYNSVYKIVNKTLTPMGARFLKKQLTEPSYDTDVLNARYDHIDLVKPHVSTLAEHLMFNDIEKLFRKIDTCTIHPLDFSVWFANIKRGIDFYDYINSQTFGTSHNTEPLQKLVDIIETTFEVDNLNKYLLNDICGSIFKTGIHPEIDLLVKRTHMCTDFMTTLATHLQTLLNQHLKMDTSAATIKVVSNDRDGHFLSMTTKRAQVLQKVLASVDTITLKTGVTISTTSLNFRLVGKGASTKIQVHEMTRHSDTLASCIDELKVANRKCFIDFLESIQKNFRVDILDLVRDIAYWDFIYSGAQAARQYNYVRPIIEPLLADDSKSYVRVTDMRHVLIELLSLSAYVPTSLQLGTEDQDCMLLFGLNSAGKSTLQKALGINILLAQIGYNVAATSFKYYPYQSLLTRISSNDNLFKGLSSFALEMSEIKAILKRSNENTLVIADEVCKGSEHKSSLIIVASIIEMLARNRTSLITATHLHELATSSSVTELKNVKMFHMHIDFDEASNTLVYDRELRPGSGENFYGLSIAKYLMNDNEFNQVTNRVKNEFTSTTIVPDKWSRYNSALNVDKCQVCGYKPEKQTDKVLETHHIQFQKNADENGFVNGMHKNHVNNLVTLCQACHDAIDTGKVVINGYAETSQGKFLL